MMVNQLCLSAFIALAASASVSAFTVPFSSIRSTAFTAATTPLYMSEAVEATPELTQEEAAAPKAVVEAGPELTQEEESAKTQRKVERVRHTLFVGNLPFETTDAAIKALFEPHGKVELVNIPRSRDTQQPRGFAFVDMGSDEEVQAAIAAIDGEAFEGRQIRVTKSLAKGEVDKTKKAEKKPMGKAEVAEGMKKIYVGNLPFSADKEEIQQFFEEYGAVTDVYIPQNPATGEGRGFAFVTMSEDDSNTAIDECNGVDFGGRTLVVNEPLPPGKKIFNRAGRTKLYVGNLSFYTVPETLEDLFGEFGTIVDCYLPEDPATGGSRGFGFVTMGNEDAQRAILEIDGCEVDGRVIRVNEAQPKGKAAPVEEMGEEESGVISGSWDDMGEQ